jgi:hypothetical protein
VDEFMGLKSPHLLDYEFEEYLAREEALFERLNHMFKAQKADEKDISRLFFTVQQWTLDADGKLDRFIIMVGEFIKSENEKQKSSLSQDQSKNQSDKP